MDEHERDILREAGRRFAALRQVVTSRCEICGTEITGTLKRRYCSNKCRVKASRQRRQGEGVAVNHDVVAEPMPAVSSTVERLAAIRERLAGAGGGDAAEDIRRSREERTAALAGPVPAAS
jgi:hypothetical protein